MLQDAERSDDACWLPGARLNIAQCCLSSRGDDAAPALVWASEDSPTRVQRLSRAQLRARCTAVACALRASKLQPGGDRKAAVCAPCAGAMCQPYMAK